jgi:hypothetical protein
MVKVFDTFVVFLSVFQLSSSMPVTGPHQANTDILDTTGTSANNLNNIYTNEATAGLVKRQLRGPEWMLDGEMRNEWLGNEESQYILNIIKTTPVYSTTSNLVLAKRSTSEEEVHEASARTPSTDLDIIHNDISTVKTTHRLTKRQDFIDAVGILIAEVPKTFIQMFLPGLYKKLLKQGLDQIYNETMENARLKAEAAKAEAIRQEEEAKAEAKRKEEEAKRKKEEAMQREKSRLLNLPGVWKSIYRNDAYRSIESILNNPSYSGLPTVPPTLTDDEQYEKWRAIHEDERQKWVTQSKETEAKIELWIANRPGECWRSYNKA